MTACSAPAGTGPRYDFQVRYARSPDELAGWPRGRSGEIGLAEVVEKVAPTILIGTSTQAGAFTEQIVKNMAAHVDRPIIMPLSNPTSKAGARPADLIRWTDGRALVAALSRYQAVPSGTEGTGGNGGNDGKAQVGPPAGGDIHRSFRRF